MLNIRDYDAIKNLADRATQLRKLNKMSQKEVAVEAKMKVTQYRRMEKGTCNSGISHIKAVASVYEMSLPEFLDYDVYTPPTENLEN